MSRREVAVTDYGRRIDFGGTIIPSAGDPGEAMALASAIEGARLEFIGIQDHPYNSHHLDTWTLIAFLAARTERVRFVPDVASLPLRPPAMLAKAAASLDVLTRGRVELGLGAGGFWEGIRAIGGPARRPGEAVVALEEAIRIIRLSFSGERVVSFEGDHYAVRGFHPGPPPAHLIEIWLGGYKPRMLSLVGSHADGWIPSSPYAPPASLPAMQARIDEAARSAGRRPADIRRAYNVMGFVTGGSATGTFEGPVEHWVDVLTTLAVEDGMDTFLYWPSRDAIQQYELFGREVVPGVRERVEQRRTVSSPAVWRTSTT